MEQKEEDVKVRLFKCICGKARLLSVVRPGKPFDRAQKKEQMELIDAGCEVSTISLFEARKQDLCFSCVL